LKEAFGDTALNKSMPRLTAVQGFFKGLFGTLPDFLIIGAQKCGTTTLYDTLVRHPAVARAEDKEVHYFDRHYNKGLLWYRGNMPRRSERRRAARNNQPFVVGEASPSYIFHPLAPARVSRLLPNVKLILLLRNPVDRAFSHYQMSLDYHDDPLSFEEAIEHEEDRLAGRMKIVLSGHHSHAWWHYGYKARGLYAEQLERWLKYFQREQFLILRSEDYSANPAAIVDQTCQFLEIPEGQIAIFDRSNVSSYNAPMNPESRARLIEFFRSHNQRLYDLIGRDMDWDK
jgi:hypothetical protein